jgi:hypothetical protein
MGVRRPRPEAAPPRWGGTLPRLRPFTITSLLALWLLAARPAAGASLARGDDRAVIMATTIEGVGPRDAPYAEGPYTCDVVVSRRCSAAGPRFTARPCGEGLSEGDPSLGDKRAAAADGFARTFRWYTCDEDDRGEGGGGRGEDAEASSRVPVSSTRVGGAGGAGGVGGAGGALSKKRAGDVWGAPSAAGTSRGGAAGGGGAHGEAPIGPARAPGADARRGRCDTDLRGPLVCLETRALYGRGAFTVEGARPASASAGGNVGGRCTCFERDKEDDTPPSRERRYSSV